MIPALGGRPDRHFTPRSGWVNDPLAVTWRDGRYHLFFQHVPATTSWAPHCHWGHAVSADLLTWEERPVALRPAPDEAGCWSGCVVRDPAGDVLLYTSVLDDALDLGRVRVARPRRTAPGEHGGDAWDRWTPGEVVAQAPDEVRAVTFRDPFVVRDGDRWRMLVGGGLAPDRDPSAATACVFGFESPDLLAWRYTGLVAARPGSETEPEWTGTSWECPQLLRVGEVDVLLVSVWDRQTLHHVAAAPGRFSGGRFSPTGPWQQLTYGVPYAATAFRSRSGRPAALTWLREVADPSAGWAGALSLPLAVDVAEDRVLLDLLVDPGGVLTWYPDGAGTTVPGADGADVAALDADGGEVVVTAVRGGGVRLPRAEGPVRVAVDGPVLEVFHGGRYGAVPV